MQLKKRGIIHFEFKKRAPVNVDWQSNMFEHEGEGGLLDRIAKEAESKEAESKETESKEAEDKEVENNDNTGTEKGDEQDA